MNNERFSPTGSSEAPQLSISYELLCLLRWLVDHDYDKVKKMVSKALAQGLKDDIQKTEKHFDKKNEAHIEEIQYSIIEFFSMLETTLLESLNEHAIQRATEKNLLPTIEHIDTTVCDDETVRSSIEKVSSKIADSTKEHAQQVLFKELLKRWKPTKKAALN